MVGCYARQTNHVGQGGATALIACSTLLHVLEIHSSTCIEYKKVFRSPTWPSRICMHRSATRGEKRGEGWFKLSFCVTPSCRDKVLSSQCNTVVVKMNAFEKCWLLSALPQGLNAVKVPLEGLFIFGIQVVARSALCDLPPIPRGLNIGLSSVKKYVETFELGCYYIVRLVFCIKLYNDTGRTLIVSLVQFCSTKL